MDHRTTKMTCSPSPSRGRGGLLVNSCCCIAAMLLAASSSANGEEEPFVGRYAPGTDVDELASIDIDQRTIVAQLASGTFAGLREAERVYSDGRFSDASATTMGELSTRAAEVLREGSSTYRAFENYYGESDYGDRWIQASFDGTSTDLANGNADFANFGLEGRTAAIRWGTALLNVWINVVGRLEGAAERCAEDEMEDDDWKTGDNDGALADWDAAVALYVGSGARTDGKGGHLLYTLAQVECERFGTCARGDVAPVNDGILDAFVDGADGLRDGDCGAATAAADGARSLATVTLVQGVLRAMYALDVVGDYQETTQGMGAAFAAAVVPLLHACGAGNAAIVWNDARPGKAPGGSYEVVRAAFERSYECLGVKCEDVGGLINLRGDAYLKGAEACGDARPVTSEVDYDDQFSGDEVEEDEEDEEDEDEDEAWNDANTSGGASQPQSSPSVPEYGGPSATQYDGPSEPRPSVEGAGGDGGARGSVNATNAALISGLAFGLLGMAGGAAVATACARRGRGKTPEALFVAPTGGDGEDGVV